MNEQDILQRFLFEDATVRGELVHLEHTFQTIADQHQYPPIIRQLLGEILAVTCLLSATIKFKGRLTVQFQGKGKLKLLLAQIDQAFHLRGLARFEGELQSDEIWQSLQQGVLTITMDPENSSHRYQGIVAWEGNSIAEAIESYFKNSEQLPTRIWLASNTHQVAGLLLQVMPAEGVVKSAKITPDDFWEHINFLTNTLTPAELLRLNHETLLKRLYPMEDVRLFEPATVEFQCTCSIERGENAVLFLGREEVEQELAEKQVIVVKCEFCSKEFKFDRIDVEKIFKKGDKPPSSTQVH